MIYAQFQLYDGISLRTLRAGSSTKLLMVSQMERQGRQNEVQISYSQFRTCGRDTNQGTYAFCVVCLGIECNYVQHKYL